MQKEDLILKALSELREDLNTFRGETNKRFEQIDKRFESIDKRFDSMDKRFDRVDKRFDRFQKENREDHRELERKIDRESGRIEEIYYCRDKVKINFGWQWAMVSCFIAMVAAAFARNFG